MKKLFTLMGMAALALPFGQTMAQTDVGVTEIMIPANGTQFFVDAPLPLQYVRENFGTTAIGGADTLFMDIDLNGPFTFTFKDPSVMFQPGDIDTSGIIFNALEPFGVTPGPVNLCVSTRLNNLTDANPGNDQTCVNVTAAYLPKDVGVTSVTVSTPALNAGDTIQPGDALDQIQFSLDNITGANDMPTGTRIPFDITIGGGAAIAGVFTLNAALPVGSGITLNIDATAAGFDLDFPSAAGAFDICVETTAGGDSDATNNGTCVSYVVADTSTSVGPPIGIEEEVAMGIEKIFYTNEQLNIQLNGQLQGATDFVIVSTSGQVVKSETANLSGIATNRIIDMSDVANGVYIINIATGDLTTSKRFVKQ